MQLRIVVPIWHLLKQDLLGMPPAGPARGHCVLCTQEVHAVYSRHVPDLTEVHGIEVLHSTPESTIKLVCLIVTT